MSKRLGEKGDIAAFPFWRQSFANRIFRFFTLGGCVLDTFEDAPTAELLKKGKRVGDAVSRYQHG